MTAHTEREGLRAHVRDLQRQIVRLRADHMAARDTALEEAAKVGDQARAERDALRALLAAARAHLLGDGHGYDSEVVVAIDAALGSEP